MTTARIDSSIAPSRDAVGVGSDDLLCRIVLGDCMEVMRRIPDKSVATVITDPPYGVTANKWDTPPDWPAWWKEVRRICIGAVVMTAQQPFATDLINSNRSAFRYDWAWDKIDKYSGFLQARTRPLRRHELVLVFADGPHTYNPQMQKRAKPYITHGGEGKTCTNYRKGRPKDVGRERTHNAPNSVLEFRAHCTDTDAHPTRKPVALMRYLVETYTNTGDVVLDPFAGGGSTLEAAKEVGRQFIGIEREPRYVAMCERRLAGSFLDLHNK